MKFILALVLTAVLGIEANAQQRSVTGRQVVEPQSSLSPEDRAIWRTYMETYHPEEFYGNGTYPLPVIHPTIIASGPDDNLRISAQCPEGTVATDPLHALKPNMTIAESINAIAKLVCVFMPLERSPQHGKR